MMNILTFQDDGGIGLKYSKDPNHFYLRLLSVNFITSEEVEK